MAFRIEYGSLDPVAFSEMMEQERRYKEAQRRLSAGGGSLDLVGAVNQQHKQWNDLISSAYAADKAAMASMVGSALHAGGQMGTAMVESDTRRDVARIEAKTGKYVSRRRLEGDLAQAEARGVGGSTADRLDPVTALQAKGTEKQYLDAVGGKPRFSAAQEAEMGALKGRLRQITTPNIFDKIAERNVSVESLDSPEAKEIFRRIQVLEASAGGAGDPNQILEQYAQVVGGMGDEASVPAPPPAPRAPREAPTFSLAPASTFTPEQMAGAIVAIDPKTLDSESGAQIQQFQQQARGVLASPELDPSAKQSALREIARRIQTVQQTSRPGKPPVTAQQMVAESVVPDGNGGGQYITNQMTGEVSHIMPEALPDATVIRGLTTNASAAQAAGDSVGAAATIAQVAATRAAVNGDMETAVKSLALAAWLRGDTTTYSAIMEAQRDMLVRQMVAEGGFAKTAQTQVGRMQDWRVMGGAPAAPRQESAPAPRRTIADLAAAPTSELKQALATPTPQPPPAGLDSFDEAVTMTPDEIEKQLREAGL